MIPAGGRAAADTVTSVGNDTLSTLPRLCWKEQGKQRVGTIAFFFQPTAQYILRRGCLRSTFSSLAMILEAPRVIWKLWEATRHISGDTLDPQGEIEQYLVVPMGALGGVWRHFGAGGSPWGYQVAPTGVILPPAAAFFSIFASKKRNPIFNTL